jgi:hypothetical protein
MSYAAATDFSKTTGFSKPEYPVWAGAGAPPTTLWHQDPATFKADCCLARKIRADRDLHWDKSVTLQWQCGRPVATGGLCGKCSGSKLEWDSATRGGSKPSWHGLITEAPPAHTEVFYGGVYRPAHGKKVTPIYSAAERVKVARPRLTEEEKAAREEAKAFGGGGRAPRGSKLTPKKLEALVAARMYARRIELMTEVGKKGADARAKHQADVEAVTAEWKAEQEAKAAELASLLGDAEEGGEEGGEEEA